MGEIKMPKEKFVEEGISSYLWINLPLNIKTYVNEEY